MPGLWFKEFSIGQRFVHEVRRTVTSDDCRFGRGPGCSASNKGLPHLWLKLFIIQGYAAWRTVEREPF